MPVERALDDLVGEDATLREALRPIIVGLVKQAMTEDAEMRLEKLQEEGLL